MMANPESDRRSRVSSEPPSVIPEDLLDQVVVTDDGMAFRVGETETTFIHVLPMLFNDRLVEVPKCAPKTYDRYWCYRKGPAAILAGLAWDGSKDTEPSGWIKSWDQRYSHEPLGEQTPTRGSGRP